MAGRHTVEKIGGSSMSQFGVIMKNVIIGKRQGMELYNRVFVVSAYGGITNLLLENKKNGTPGAYAKFADNDPGWKESLEEVRAAMIKFNRSFAELGLDQEKADTFVNERVDGVRNCLDDLESIRSFGHFQPGDYLPASREFLSSIGEAHSAYNSALILQGHGVNARFVDLTGWKDTRALPMDEMIAVSFKDIDFTGELPIVTGYVKCAEGIMNRFDRGYSEITFSKVSVVTDAREGIIHKEYHLSTGDPVLIGIDKVRIMGNTNFDIADQMSDMEVEAIHAKASKEMEMKDIPIRVKNAFDPEHSGTVIAKDYVSAEPRVEMICGRDDIVAVEVFDPEMVGQPGYDHHLLGHFARHNISYIAKNTNANTIDHYVSGKAKKLKDCVEAIRSAFPNAQVTLREVAVVSVIGSNMKIPGFLHKAARALAHAKINVLALDQCMRQVNMQFIIERKDFNNAQITLHREFVEIP